MNLLLTIVQWLQQGNGLIIVGSLLCCLGVLYFIRRLIGLSEKVIKRNQVTLKKKSRVKINRLVMSSLIVLVIFLSGTSLILAGVSLKTYKTFTKEKLIGTIECLNWNRNEKKILVKFIPAQKDKDEVVQSYSLLGDQWEVKARILKWNPKVNLIGIHTGYRLQQIKGIYDEADDVSQNQHTAYSLQVGRDWLWWFLSKFNQRLPLVEAVYGNAVSRPARTGEIYDIYVTTSGLIAKQKKKEKQQLFSF